MSDHRDALRRGSRNVALNSLSDFLPLPDSVSVLVLVADGARPDTLAAALDTGSLPALARLRDEGGMHTVTTAWPSVTGPGYTPFLLGRYPSPVGLPGLRWYDRARGIGALNGHARSYIGWGMRRIDEDLSPDAPTIFELEPDSLGALNVIGRGLPGSRVLGRGARFVARAALTHFRGDLPGWLAIDHDIGAALAARIRCTRPAFTFAAFTGIDKASHASGHDSPNVLHAMRLFDETVAELRHDAEQAGMWEDTHLWIVSDHGHSNVTRGGHDDLAMLFRDMGLRVLAHPWAFGTGADVAVMVSGNSMAHVYFELDRRERPFWPALNERWNATVQELCERPSIDLVILPHSPHRVEVRGKGRGSAMIECRDGTYDYIPETGDPLGIGALECVCSRDAYEATLASDYPDGVVQIAHAATASRAGEVLLSASRGWDFRERYEPIPHRSTHGALHRDHMLVPLLTNHPTPSTPRRTVDVMPSALAALGLPIPAGLDGESFLVHHEELVRR
jgi:hypothetical protein